MQTATHYLRRKRTCDGNALRYGDVESALRQLDHDGRLRNLVAKSRPNEEEENENFNELDTACVDLASKIEQLANLCGARKGDLDNLLSSETMEGLMNVMEDISKIRTIASDLLSLYPGEPVKSYLASLESFDINLCKLLNVHLEISTDPNGGKPDDAVFLFQSPGEPSLSVSLVGLGPERPGMESASVTSYESTGLDMGSERGYQARRIASQMYSRGYKEGYAEFFRLSNLYAMGSEDEEHLGSNQTRGTIVDFLLEVASVSLTLEQQTNQQS